MEAEQHLVNGALMKKYVGSEVRLWIEVSGTSSGGRQIQGTTSDNKTVTVALETPLNQPLEGWIEIIGKPVGNGSTINCSEIVVFPTDENSEPFDVEAHNGIILAMDNMKDFYESGDNTGY